jgi:hypothetical protein
MSAPGAPRGSGVTPRLTPKRRRRAVGNDEYGTLLRRLLRAWVRRGADGDGDLAVLEDMTALAGELEGYRIDLIAELRHSSRPASWAEIGRALGTSRQVAQRRYGKVGGARRPGGQPGHLR